MQFNTFISTEEDLEACARAPSLREVLIEPELLARQGRLGLDRARCLAGEARRRGFRTVLVWDILMTPEEFSAAAEALHEAGPENFDAIRVQCPGAARYLMRRLPLSRIHFIADIGACNLEALKCLTGFIGNQLERVILSPQLPAKKIACYVKALRPECEILGCGRIMLFHSRRKLLRKNFGNGAEDLEGIAAAEDLHGRLLQVTDNSHGTFLFLDKDQFVLHRMEELADGVPQFICLDLRHLSRPPDSASGIDDVAAAAIADPQSLRGQWPRETCAPFFRTNETTKQFKFL